MKELLEKYYLKLSKLHKEKFNSAPTVPFFEKADKDMIISEPDEDDYVEWKMMPVEDIDVSEFGLTDELKELYTTYRYFHLVGRLDGYDLYFEPIYGDVKKIISIIKSKGEYYKEGYFFLGTADKDGNDDLIMLYKDGEILMYDTDLETSKKLNYTLSEVIDKMEALF